MNPVFALGMSMLLPNDKDLLKDSEIFKDAPALCTLLCKSNLI